MQNIFQLNMKNEHVDKVSFHMWKNTESNNLFSTQVAGGEYAISSHRGSLHF